MHDSGRPAFPFVPGRAGVWLFWLALYGLATFLLLQVVQRPDVRVAHGVLIYLLLIIGASRQGGRVLSAVMVILGYLAMDYLFVPPRFAFGSASDLDLLVLVGFTLTGVLVSELFAGLQRAVAVAQDRTEEVERLSRERLQLEQEAGLARSLQEADRLKNALLTSLVHDLRSPIATLTLLADPVSPLPAETARQRIHDEARRLGDFIWTLQRFATGDAATPLVQQPHAARALVQATLRSAEARLAGRPVEVMMPPGVRDTEADAIVVTCDAPLSLQVLGNLLQNAVRYAPASEPILITVEPQAETVDFIVSDRGPGVAPERLPQIFSPLRRPLEQVGPVEPEESVAAEGSHDVEAPEALTDLRMGMGLAISRTFARVQRGELRYEPRPGGGSRFIFTLPRTGRVSADGAGGLAASTEPGVA